LTCRSVVFALLLAAPFPALASCTDNERGGSADAGTDGTAYALNVTAIDRRFDTRDHFIASVEMQLSGEPFAEAMGRDVAGYARDYTCQGSVCSPSVYADPEAPLVDGGAPEPVIDLAGFSSGIESYEYSKQPMNDIAFESGAGTSLLFGPVSNPERATGAAALKLAQDFVGHVADETPRHASSWVSRRTVRRSAGPGSGPRCNRTRRGIPPSIRPTKRDARSPPTTIRPSFTR
jgi:hypothetical protein